MVTDDARANRRAHEQDRARRDRERQALPPSQAQAPEPAAPGTLAHSLDAQAELRAALAAAPDWRSDPHREVARVWGELPEEAEGVTGACIRLYGHAPSVDSWNQPSDAATAALAHAKDAEADLLRACASSTASDAVVAELRDQFYLAVRLWQGAAVMGWPSRAEYERQQANHRRTW